MEEVQSLSSPKARLQTFGALVLINLVVAALGFATTVRIANVLGKVEYGRLAFAMILGLYAATAIRFGSGRTLVRDLVQSPERLGQVVVTSLMLRVLVLAVVAAAALLWNGLSGPGNGLSWTSLAVVAGTALAAMDLQAVYDAWGTMRRHALFGLLQKCVYVAIVWAAVLSAPDRLSIGVVGVALLAAAGVGLAVQYAWAWPSIAPIRTVALLRWVRCSGVRPTRSY